MSRKAPAASATLFPVGTTQQGNDGRAWRVAATKTGVRRWRAVPERGACPVTGGRCECAAGGAGPKKSTSVPTPTPRGRVGPSPSATLYEVGTRKKGNDGRMWAVAAASNGVRRWVRVPAPGGRVRAPAPSKPKPASRRRKPPT
jgi:hypothetical protein